jgi:hypothetical protein
MKQLLISVLLFLTALFAGAQTTSTWKTDSVYDDYFEKPFFSKLDAARFSGADMQIRMWFSNGFSKVNTVTLICLTHKNKTWDAASFAFTRKMFDPVLKDSAIISQKAIVPLKTDSLYKELLKDSLLTIRSDGIGALLDANNNHRWNWTDSGPMVYTIEIITPGKKWCLRYPCPDYFYNKYKLEELKTPVKIINTLLAVVGINPC